MKNPQTFIRTDSIYEIKHPPPLSTNYVPKCNSYETKLNQFETNRRIDTIYVVHAVLMH